MNTDAQTWVPRACTLPTEEHPLRMAEFDELFTTLRGIARKGSTRLRIELEPAPQVAEKAAGLAMREIGCCSFFTFTLTAATGELQLDITVPATQAPILDALHTRATTAAGSPT